MCESQQHTARLTSCKWIVSRERFGACVFRRQLYLSPDVRLMESVLCVIALSFLSLCMWMISLSVSLSLCLSVSLSLSLSLSLWMISLSLYVNDLSLCLSVSLSLCLSLSVSVSVSVSLWMMSLCLSFFLILNESKITHRLCSITPQGQWVGVTGCREIRAGMVEMVAGVGALLRSSFHFSSALYFFSASLSNLFSLVCFLSDLLCTCCLKNKSMWKKAHHALQHRCISASQSTSAQRLN